jgi:hypothetical protein
MKALAYRDLGMGLDARQHPLIHPLGAAGLRKGHRDGGCSLSLVEVGRQRATFKI